MNSTVSFAKYCLFAAAAGACATAIAVWAPEQGIPEVFPSGNTTGYLDCARVLSERLDPDLVALCSMQA
jgi:hypothetical protein